MELLHTDSGPWRTPNYNIVVGPISEPWTVPIALESQVYALLPLHLYMNTSALSGDPFHSVCSFVSLNSMHCEINSLVHSIFNVSSINENFGFNRNFKMQYSSIDSHACSTSCIFQVRGRQPLVCGPKLSRRVIVNGMLPMVRSPCFYTIDKVCLSHLLLNSHWML